ncbi:MAG: site-2 protease family protein [Pseudomonadota bacterium]
MFSNARTIATVFGFEIRIDPSWLLIAALITWSLCQHTFPAAIPGLSQGTYVAMAVLAMLLFFASLLGHELAHALTARRYGVETRGITLFLFGGVAELSKEPTRAIHEFWIALAGPAMSFLLAFVFWVIAGMGVLMLGAGPATEVVGYLALINFVLAVFNLLPAFPLDGGRILRAWLWHRGGDMLAATEKAAQAGATLAYGLILLGVLALFQGAMIGGFWQILLGVFVLAAARGSVEAQRIKSLLGTHTIRDLMTAAPITTDPQTTLATLVNRIMLGKRVSFVPVVEKGTLLGHIDINLLSGIDRENWANTTVGDVFVGLGDSDCLPPDFPVPELFERIAQTGHRKYMVVDNGRLVGVISLSDLTRHLGLVASLGKNRLKAVHP